MQTELKFLEENKNELIDNLEKMKSQKADSGSLIEELNPAKAFTCKRCDDIFENRRDLRSHMKIEHKEREPHQQ